MQLPQEKEKIINDKEAINLEKFEEELSQHDQINPEESDVAGHYNASKSFEEMEQVGISVLGLICKKCNLKY